MSWAEEDWTVGLSGRVLQKVKELQVQQERLSRENKQKQLQLDNIHISLEKQTVKYDEVRGELHSVQRELQSVQEEAKASLIGKERLAQELQTKQAQVCSFEGQLDAARTLNNKLTQEVKRLEAELEKLQNSGRPADTSLYSTPCWSASSPWEHNGSRKEEERPGRQDETQNRAQHIRQRLHFSDSAPTSVPRQQHRSTPHRHPSDQSQCFSTPSAAFPWERDDTRPATRRQSPTSPPAPCADVISQAQSAAGLRGKEPDRRTETDTSVSQMQNRVSRLEEELSEKTRMLKSTQSDLAQSKKDVGARDISLQKARDELSLAHTRITQESERASGAEQRLKQFQEELRCQRQNAESSRLQHQQRTKDMEKQHQRDLSELQKERQSLEKQHQQEVNKLNQELQQARTLHNALQAQADKLSLQKQTLDKELEMMKEKLKWTEAQLQESQKKEAQTQAKLMEALREAEGVAVTLEQSRKRERGLEEEGKRLAEERADALRLLKDLQEQKSAPAPQIVQICSVGQSFPPQPAHVPHSRPSTHTKKTTAPIRAEHRKEDATEDRTEITASYPSDREPGEGIDSEHISELLSTETSQRERKSDEKENLRNEDAESDSLGTKSRSSLNSELLPSSQSTAEDSSEKPERSKTSEDLRRENAMLTSEIKDLREELNRRLEDLESQRRAEAEARTRLKQFSRRFSSQAQEREEQEKEWRTQLESERAETEKLRKAVAALETEMKRRNEEGEKPREEEREEEKNKALEDRENEMIELNIQLKKQLSQVKAQLALEQEERTREEEARNQLTVSDADEKKELRVKVEELEAELEELKRSREEEEEKGRERLPPASSPLVYLTLNDDEPDSVNKEHRLLPSPEQHLLFCRTTNQINMLVSQATADLIQQEQTPIDPKQIPQPDDGHGGQLAPDPEDYLGGSLPAKHGEEISQLRESQCASSDLEREVTQLHQEKKREVERAKQSQVKLEALQSQVTRQTQQLTMAFEKQCQHIAGLLAELQEKESALLSQGEELQRCKRELAAFRAEKKETENQRQRRAEKPKSIELEPNKEKDHSAISDSTMSPADEDSAVQTDEDQTRTDATPLSEDDSEALSLGERGPGSVDSDKTESNLDSACVMEELSQDAAAAADVMSELLALRRENQLLKQRMEGFTPSERVRPDFPTEGRKTGSRGGDEGDVNVEEITEVEDEESQHHIQVLEKQVVALHMQIRALSLETQQQTEELALWRLASQSAPSFDPGKENQDQNSTVKQLQASALLLQENQGHVTVIREDELLLSDSSHKLQGRMLFSSLQQSNLPEPKRVNFSKKTAALQEHNQDSARIDEESEKENVLQWSDLCPSQHKDERDADVIRLSSEVMSQHFPKGPSKTKATENPAAKPNAPKTTGATNATDVKDVGSQTEERLYPTSPQLRCASTQTEEEEEEEVESPPMSPLPSSAEAGVGDKMLFAGSFPIPADPARLAERIRRNRTQLSAAFDDTEYEPYGLPEVVMKGFADIPTGPSCPYIVRRGLLGTVVPVAQKDQQDETD